MIMGFLRHACCGNNMPARRTIRMRDFDLFFTLIL